MKYVSELKELENKKFDTIEDLEKAEEEVKTALAKKAHYVQACMMLIIITQYI